MKEKYEKLTLMFPCPKCKGQVFADVKGRFFMRSLLVKFPPFLCLHCGAKITKERLSDLPMRPFSRERVRRKRKRYVVCVLKG